jgi:hypothetical protein
VDGSRPENALRTHPTFMHTYGHKRDAKGLCLICTVWGGEGGVFVQCPSVGRTSVIKRDAGDDSVTQAYMNMDAEPHVNKII